MNEQETLKQIAEEEKKHKLLLSNYADVVKTAAGRAVIWDILDACGIYASIPPSEKQTEFLLGKRDLGIFIISRLGARDPGAYPKILSEKLNNG